MEVYMFLIVIGMLIAFGFTVIGICIGRMDKRELRHSDNSSSVCSDCNNRFHSSVGDIHGEINSRRDMELGREEEKAIKEKRIVQLANELSIKLMPNNVK